jgi:hypothetical protein
MRKTFKKVLIAHKHNNYRPHLLREAGVVTAIAFVVAVFVAGNSLGTWISRTDLGAAIYPGVLADLANHNRSTSGLGHLAVNPLLEKAAMLKAEDMAARGYFSHNSPDGREPWYWINQAGYDYLYAGENLAIDFSDSADIQNAWMNSAGHRANILNSRFTEVGIAMKEGVFEGKTTVFVVQMFGSPKVKQVPAKVEPAKNLEPAIELAQTPKETAQLAAVPKSQNPTVKSAETSAPTSPIEIQVTANNASKETYSSWFERAVSSPSKAVFILYALVSLAALIALLSLVIAEIQYRDKRHIAYGLLILLITFFFAYLEWITVFSSLRIA